MLFLITGIASANNEEKIKEEITVLKLPYGVTVELESDKRLPAEWWHVISLDVNQDLNTKIFHSFLGFSFGNSITDFSIGYSRELSNLEEDWGIVNFSFSWSF